MFRVWRGGEGGGGRGEGGRGEASLEGAIPGSMCGRIVWGLAASGCSVERVDAPDEKFSSPVNFGSHLSAASSSASFSRVDPAIVEVKRLVAGGGCQWPPGGALKL